MVPAVVQSLPPVAVSTNLSAGAESPLTSEMTTEKARSAPGVPVTVAVAMLNVPG